MVINTGISFLYQRAEGGQSCERADVYILPKKYHKRKS